MVLFAITVTEDCGNSWTCELMSSVSLGIFLTLIWSSVCFAALLSSHSGTNCSLYYVSSVDTVPQGTDDLSLWYFLFSALSQMISLSPSSTALVSSSTVLSLL